MKKLFYLAVTAWMCISFIFTACGPSESAFLDFGEKVAKIAADNDIEAFQSLYPEANFDTISFSGNTGDFKVEQTEEDGITRIILGDNKWIDVKQNGDSFQIVSCKGLASFPSDKLEIAKATGMADANTPDAELSEKINDNDFFIWLENKTDELAMKALKMELGKKNITSRYDAECNRGSWPVTITNTSSNPIAASDYSVNYTAVYENSSDGTAPNSYVKRTAPSKDIAPGQTVTIVCSESCCLTLQTPSLEILPKAKAKLAAFTGKEYREYRGAK